MLSFLFSQVEALKTCYLSTKHAKGASYIGNISVTVSGLTCQPWYSQQPHAYQFHDVSLFPDFTLQDAANFCRNPGIDKSSPWCFTTDPDVPWEYCDVPVCKRGIQVIAVLVDIIFVFQHLFFAFFIVNLLQFPMLIIPKT